MDGFGDFLDELVRLADVYFLAFVMIAALFFFELIFHIFSNKKTVKTLIIWGMRDGLLLFSMFLMCFANVLVIDAAGKRFYDQVTAKSDLCVYIFVFALISYIGAGILNVVMLMLKRRNKKVGE